MQEYAASRLSQIYAKVHTIDFMVMDFAAMSDCCIRQTEMIPIREV